MMRVILNGVRNHNLLNGLGEDILRPSPANRPHLLKRLDDFLYKEGIPFCLLHDERLERCWELLCGEDRLGHLHTI